jgi:hypothetical protein
LQSGGEKVEGLLDGFSGMTGLQVEAVLLHTALGILANPMAISKIHGLIGGLVSWDRDMTVTSSSSFRS